MNRKVHNRYGGGRFGAAVFLVTAMLLVAFAGNAFALDVFERDMVSARAEAEKLLSVREALVLKYDALFRAWSDAGSNPATKPLYSDFAGKKASQLDIAGVYYNDVDGFSANISVESTGNPDSVRLVSASVPENIGVLAVEMLPNAVHQSGSLRLVVSRPTVLDDSDYVKTNKENLMLWGATAASQSKIRWANWNTGVGLVEVGVLRAYALGNAGDNVRVRGNLTVQGNPVVGNTGTFLQNVDVQGTLFAQNISLTGTVTLGELRTIAGITAAGADFSGGTTVFGNATRGISVATTGTGASTTGTMTFGDGSTMKTSTGTVEMFGALSSYGVNAAGTTVTASKYGITKEGHAVVKNLYVTGSSSMATAPRISGKTGASGSEWDLWVTGLKSFAVSGATSVDFKYRPAFIATTAAEKTASTKTYDHSTAMRQVTLDVGEWQIEAWGAGPKAGYVKGVLPIYANKTFAVYVGQKATTTAGGWNGGGAGGAGTLGGHGATDIRVVDGAWTVNAASVSNAASLRRRILVAGGGSGSGAWGGGPAAPDGGGDVRDGKGGKQNGGGAGGAVGGVTGSTAGAPGVFGMAQASSGYGGGGGWYGGGGGAKKGTKLMPVLTSWPEGGIVDETTKPGSRLHYFKSNATFKNTIGNLIINYIIVGPGGISSPSYYRNTDGYSSTTLGGAGGGGGVVERLNVSIAQGVYPVVVGQATQQIGAPQTTDKNSSFLGVTAYMGASSSGWHQKIHSGDKKTYCIMDYYTNPTKYYRPDQGHPVGPPTETDCIGHPGNIYGETSEQRIGGGGAGGPGNYNNGGPGYISKVDGKTYGEGGSLKSFSGYSRTYPIGYHYINKNSTVHNGKGGDSRSNPTTTYHACEWTANNRFYSCENSVGLANHGVVVVGYSKTKPDGTPTNSNMETTAIPDGKAGGGSNFVSGGNGFQAVNYSGTVLSHSMHPSGLVFKDVVSAQGVDSPSATGGRIVMTKLSKHNVSGTWSQSTKKISEFIQFVENTPDHEFCFRGESCW